MRKAPEGSPVYCKMEKNERFTQPKTVKLQADSTYRMDVSFIPPRNLEYVNLSENKFKFLVYQASLKEDDKTTDTECAQIAQVMISFPKIFLTIDGNEITARERSRDSTANAYSTYYSTKGLTPSRRGTRQIMTITMKVQGSGDVSTRIQVKVYNQTDVAHCEWGSKLHCIELDCSNNGANIIKETYRKIEKDT
ncbi:hypothetical protein RUM44_014010 [Polyplax serrata]|uniref:CB1 cannabinoid receptor-interacting protein 1 n=1 Tax=Polyplax serrata TaxID=468196 RepID=A0ABR1BJD7_POLSC